MEQRINSDNSVNFLQEVLKKSLKKNIRSNLTELDPELLKIFNRALLQDSTIGQLDEALAQEFKGSGGSASKSAFKIDLVFDYKHNEYLGITLSKGSISDQSRAETFISQMEASDLMIREIGYFSVSSLMKIAKKDAFFLSRLFKGVNVYLGENDKDPVDLPAYLNKHYKDQNIIDLQIYIGKEERFLCRLVAYRSPADVISQRRRDAKKNAKKKGRTPTDEFLTWLEFSLFITNVDETVWSPEVVGTVYRIRWQIELTFKTWKSLLNIHILKGQRAERIRCIIYGRLICLTLINMCYSVVSNLAQKIGREASPKKVIDWLLRKERFMKSLYNDSIMELIQNIDSNIKKLCKQKRYRRTTQELIFEEIEYFDGFNEC